MLEKFTAPLPEASRVTVPLLAVVLSVNNRSVVAAAPEYLSVVPSASNRLVAAADDWPSGLALATTSSDAKFNVPPLTVVAPV